MCYARQKEFVESVTGAKRSETEGKRIKQAMARCAPGQDRADRSGGLALPQRIRDPVVEHPLFFQREDGQEQFFVDIFQVLPPADACRVERLRNERFERL